jgi:hypothetical protein
MAVPGRPTARRKKMVPQRTRRAAAALALAATLALAAPAHAAGRADLAAGPRWIESVLEWVARLWVGNGLATEPKPAVEKCGYTINPDGGCSGGTPPPTSSSTGGSGSGS